MTDVLNPLRTDADAIPTIVSRLRKELGLRIAKVVLNVDGPTMAKWIKGSVEPSPHQKRLIYAAGYVVNVLNSFLQPRDVKLWMVSPSEYLYGIPALELRKRPEDVQQAALNRVSRGEHYEVLEGQLAATKEDITYDPT